MSEVKRYHVTEAGLVEGQALGRINVVLAPDYDQLICKVGNMVCAKRQMDEELEIARDDLLIFKGALSALGEASKKLVVCARTTGGTAGPDQILMDACASVEGVITLGGVARAMDEFDRVTAERDALQALLTAADERADVLDGLLRQVSASCALTWEDHQPTADTLELQDLIDAALKPAEGGGDDA